MTQEAKPAFPLDRPNSGFDSRDGGHSPEPQWFKPTGICKCGRMATGELMTRRNTSLGPHCARCASVAIKRALKAREAEARKPLPPVHS